MSARGRVLEGSKGDVCLGWVLRADVGSVRWLDQAAAEWLTTGLMVVAELPQSPYS